MVALVQQMVLMAYDGAETLGDRFSHARQCLIEMAPNARRPGKTYQGYAKATKRLPPGTLDQLQAHLRKEHQRVAGARWKRYGWVILACDGSRVEVPRTARNEEAFGCAGRDKTGPQLGVTTLYHMGTGLPWAWQVGAGTDSERTQLRAMLDTLPAESLLVADAGFTGYDLLQTLNAQDTSFLIRVGANVSLLTQLGLEVESDGEVVWLWPKGKRDQPPMKLRLIRLSHENGSDAMFLLTNVFDTERLSDTRAATLYSMRWGVEVFFRSYKQTLEQRKMRSDAPEQALWECQAGLLAVLLLGLMSVEGMIDHGEDPLGWSVAAALRTVRDAMRTPKRWRRRGDLRVLLATARKDSYQRQGSKKARNWPHKKNEGPPGHPMLRRATANETLRAKRVYRAA